MSGEFEIIVWDCDDWEAGCAKVLEDVAAERQRQVARYGHNTALHDGTGPEVAWLSPLSWVSAAGVEREFRGDYERHEALAGDPTWMHLIREEVSEAFQETDPSRLRAELVQVAALCVSWVEKIDKRGND